MSTAFLLVLAVISVAFSQTYQITTGWSNSDCTGDLNVALILSDEGDCSAQACESGAKVECGIEDALKYGSLGVVSLTFNSTDCTGTIIQAASIRKDVCVSTAPGTSSFLTCEDDDGVTSVTNKIYLSPNCTGPVETNFVIEANNTCFPIADSGSQIVTCGAVCFHEDTLISYQGSKFTLAQLQTSEAPICAIPHVVVSNGVKISTTCPGVLRLTNDHLVYTHDGLQSAATVKVGDFLYSDMEQKNTCEVTKIEIEVAQTYFGLNCEESEVLADGYKTSTFGIFHEVPAAWMKYASKVLGVHAASALGDSFASLLSKIKLI